MGWGGGYVSFSMRGFGRKRRATRRFSKFPAPRSCDDVTGPTPRVPRSVDHRRPERTKREYGESGGGGSFCRGSNWIFFSAPSFFSFSRGKFSVSSRFPIISRCECVILFLNYYSWCIFNIIRFFSKFEWRYFIIIF